MNPDLDPVVAVMFNPLGAVLAINVDGEDPVERALATLSGEAACRAYTWR